MILHPSLQDGQDIHRFLNFQDILPEQRLNSCQVQEFQTSPSSLSGDKALSILFPSQGKKAQLC